MRDGEEGSLTSAPSFFSWSQDFFYCANAQTNRQANYKIETNPLMISDLVRPQVPIILINENDHIFHQQVILQEFVQVELQMETQEKYILSLSLWKPSNLISK